MVSVANYCKMSSLWLIEQKWASAVNGSGSEQNQTWLQVFMPPELCPAHHYPIIFSFVLMRRPYPSLQDCIKHRAYYCDVIIIYYICASDAEHRGRPPGCGWTGADVQTLLQLVPRPVLSHGQALPPRLCQTSANGSRYDDGPPV